MNATSDAESSSESETVGARTLADGSFEFPRLHRGRWSVTAVAPPAGAVVREVDVVDKDIDELEIRLAEPFTLNVKIGRDPSPANPQSKTEMRVFLIGEGDGHLRPTTGVVLANGYNGMNAKIRFSTGRTAPACARGSAAEGPHVPALRGSALWTKDRLFRRP